MKNLFSLCLLALLTANAVPTIILTESIPRIAQIGKDKFIITIDEPQESAIKVTKPSSKNMLQSQHESPQEGVRSENTKDASQKASERGQVAQSPNTSQASESRVKVETTLKAATSDEKNGGSVPLLISSNHKSSKASSTPVIGMANPKSS